MKFISRLTTVFKTLKNSHEKFNAALNFEHIFVNLHG